MIWLNVQQNENKTLYFDVQRIESRPGPGEDGYALSGTVGDGECEAAVLVEVGERTEVTYVDAWLNTGDLQGFFRRVDREAFENALSLAAGEMRFCVENFPSLAGKPRRQVTGFRAEGRWMALRPESYGEQLELPIAVAEETGEWRRQVA